MTARQSAAVDRALTLVAAGSTASAAARASGCDLRTLRRAMRRNGVQPLARPQPDTPSLRSIRFALQAKYGPRQYRITRDGSIHVYGRLPNSGIVGWWYLGQVGDPRLAI